MLILTAYKQPISLVLLFNLFVEDLPQLALPVWVFYVNGTHYTDTPTLLSLIGSSLLVVVSVCRIIYGAYS